jgi:hypothetical protein
MSYYIHYKPLCPVTFDPQCVTFGLPTWSKVTTDEFFSSLCDSCKIHNNKVNQDTNVKNINGLYIWLY